MARIVLCRVVQKTGELTIPETAANQQKKQQSQTASSQNQYFGMSTQRRKKKGGPRRQVHLSGARMAFG
jgi:hypothetical protein